ncbi:HNH endonuclease signature motif containing protein [Nocardioides pocheonensis]|uniref:HNH endonuclease n=1 Tax=Nocardioides pocheonensis TaxID=661485 RepID=A0A3N0GMA9_9ACTN|nr:HNH endonuclease signature motif containing protein [Nocardioides pocheonensis]RNM13614.1 HNH endonuclease [Nocardioides pocheonensis]
MTALPVPRHPILGCLADIGRALDDVAGAQPLYLSTAEKAAALRELAVLEARMAGLRLRVMAAAGDVAEAEGARDVAAWWSHHTLAEPETARADARLAASLDGPRPQVAQALAAGRCSVAQAQVIVRCLDELPDRVGADVVERAEATLVGYAEHFRPIQLRRLGRHILEVVAPEVAEAEEARRWASEERHAREKTRISLRTLGDGTSRLTGRLPDAAASRLKTYLEAFTSPRVSAGSTTASAQRSLAPVDRVPYPRRLGQAFCALLEHLDPATLPHHGGDATTVIVTVGLDQLRAELATAGILGGADETVLSAGELRRLACNAHVIPAVLGGKSEVLDLGRAQRLFSAAQRRAMRLRDQECRAEGCRVPATWCEAHHVRPWARGGRTDVADGVLLCSHHHHRAHDDRYAADRLPNGDVRFRRRT